MADKQLKLKLKEARDAVNSEDMKTAILACKEILNEDKNHYMAHLIIAKAYQDSDQAAAASYLKRAISLTKDPLIPYQGLAKCAAPTDLPGVLFELIKLQPDKFKEHFEKLIECGKKLPDPEPCLAVLQTLLQGLDVDDELKRDSIFLTLSELFLRQKEVPEKWKKLYAQSLQRSIKRSTVDQHENYRRCIKLFSEVKCNVDLLIVCCDMHESFKKDSYPLEWICKVYTENIKTGEIENVKEVLKRDIREYVEALYVLNPKSILGLITKGMHHYESGEYFEALDIFTAVNEVKPNWATCLRMLVQIYMKFRAFQLAERCYRDLNVRDVHFATCLLANAKGDEALKVLREIGETGGEEERAQVVYLTVWCKLLLGSSEWLEDLKSLEGLHEKLFIKATILQKSFKRNNEEALELFTKLGDELDSDDLVKRGELEYMLRRPGFILSLMNALKRDLSNSVAFYWLGRVYCEDKDHLRSAKCIEKCLRMNPLNEEALQVLKELAAYSDDNDKLYKELLDVATRHAFELGIFFPIRMLADYYRDHGDINEAAIYYRKALRLNTTDYDCWLALGLIQMENGSYAAAQKIFEKICQLFPGSKVSAKLKIAVIKNKMNLFPEAVKGFEELIAADHNSLEVFTEYAKAHLFMAEETKAKRLFGRSQVHLQDAVSLLCRAHNLQSEDLEVNTLLGKTLNYAAILPPQHSFVDLPGALIPASVENDTHLVNLRRENLFVLANKFFETAINLCDTEPTDELYYLRAENYFLHFNSSPDADGGALQVLQSAVACIKLAIGLNPNRWEYWNLYGLLLSTDEIGEPTVAEEIFTVALEVNKSSFTVWANLGTLYLKCNEVAAANRAFGKAQENEISYENGWLGQAMLADRLAAEDDAMGLYRHCLELGYHQLAALGYAKWVTHRLDQVHVKKYQFEVEKMYAVPLCLDTISWYMKEADSNASVKSLCYLGYLAYHQERYPLAADAYLKATEKAEGDELDDILFNLGYIYLVMERPEQAVKAFKHIQRISLEAQIGLAVAHFHAKDYKVTYSIYESALESLAQTDEQRIEILSAMAALVYEFQEAEDAKMILMQCVSLNNPIKGLLNICALYLLQNDLQTAGLVVKELKAYENNLEHCADVAFLISFYYVKRNEQKKAINYLLSMIHKFPVNAKLRTIFVNLVVSWRGSDISTRLASGRIAESVLSLTKNEMLQSNSSELSGALALISLTKDGVNAAQQRIYAQKAMFVNPASLAAKRAMEMCRT